MKPSQSEAQQLFQRLIFEESNPQDWAQDVWDLNPVLGESASRLLEAFEALIECCPPEKLDNLLTQYYRERLEGR